MRAAFTPALLAGSRIFQMDEISKSLRMHCYRCSPSATPTCIMFAPQNTMHPESPLHCPHSPNDRGTLFKSPRSPASVGEGTLSSLQAGVDPGFLSGGKGRGRFRAPFLPASMVSASSGFSPTLPPTVVIGVAPPRRWQEDGRCFPRPVRFHLSLGLHGHLVGE